ncbi:MAG: MmcQ/YjbR family DNA-binding protein [Devosia sp.]
MSPTSRAGFERFVAGLPGTSLVEQWESVVAKVGGKVFCLLGPSDGSIAFKVSQTSFEGLTACPGIGQAPYFARGQWVTAKRGALEEETLRAYLKEAHRIIAAKLTKKARAELGL